MKVSYVKKVSLLALCISLMVFAGCGMKSNQNGMPSVKQDKESEDIQQNDGMDTDGGEEKDVSNQPDVSKYADIDLLTCEDLDPEYLRLASTNFYVWINYGDNVTVNALGQVIKAADIRVSGIRDLITDKITFYSVSYESFAKNDDYYYSIGSTSKLYDVSGKMLFDWDRVEYQRGFDDWIILKKYKYSDDGDAVYDESRMINAYSGECVENVSWLDKTGDCFVVSDNEGNYVYAIDRNGKQLFDFSEIRAGLGEDAYIYTYKDYIVANDSDENEDSTVIWFFTPEGRTLGYVSNVNDSYVYNSDILGSYALVDNTIYDPSKGDGGELTPIYFNEVTEYFDGDVAIRCNNAGEVDEKRDMVDANTGEPLSERFEAIYPEGNYDSYSLDHTPTYFIGVTGDRIAKLDRNGSVVAEITIPNLYYVMPYENGIRCAVDDWDSECLLDTDLNVLIPSGKYTTVATAYNDAEDSNLGLWIGTYYMDENNEHQRCEVITEKGEVLIDGLSQVELIRNNNIGVVKGQFFGIMDLNGNWIYKISKHDVSNMD